MKRFFGRISTRAWIISAIVVGMLVLSAGGVYAYTQVIAPRLAQRAYGPTSASGGVAARQGKRANRQNGQNRQGAGAGAGGGGTAAQLQRLIAGGIRGQVTVQDAAAPGGFAVIAWAKGSVTSIDATTGQVSIQEADGTSAAYTIPASARVLVGGTQATLAAVRQGTAIYVVTRQLQGGTPTVMAVVSQSNTAAAGAAPNGIGTPTPTNG